jgi:hypothetical protein
MLLCDSSHDSDARNLAGASEHVWREVSFLLRWNGTSWKQVRFAHPRGHYRAVVSGNRVMPVTSAVTACATPRAGQPRSSPMSSAAALPLAGAVTGTNKAGLTAAGMSDIRSSRGGSLSGPRQGGTRRLTTRYQARPRNTGRQSHPEPATGIPGNYGKQFYCSTDPVPVREGSRASSSGGGKVEASRERQEALAPAAAQ